MATFHIVSPRHFEAWGPTSPDDPGIGGSETMHCEMAWRLAARGHEVFSYAPLYEGVPRVYKGVFWRPLEELEWHAPGIWVLVRGLELAGSLEGPAGGQRLWCVMQDADHPQTWEEDWEPKIERVIGLCSAHVQFLKHRHPTFAPKIVQSRNGLRADLVEQLLRAPIQRNPHRLMYASSPDRGLLGLLEVFRTIRFYERKAELHVFYGFDNMHKVPNARVREMIRILHARLHADGITLHGRLGQTALYREWLHSALYVHPTNFLETGHIALMEAQALGAIPIVNPQWATGEQLLAGVGIEGDGERDQLTLRHYAHAALYLLEHADELEETRLKMMQEARKRFDWEGVVDQYEAWAEERP